MEYPNTSTPALLCSTLNLKKTFFATQVLYFTNQFYFQILKKKKYFDKNFILKALTPYQTSKS
jgi:hypothetical protein